MQSSESVLNSIVAAPGPRLAQPRRRRTVENGGNLRNSYGVALKPSGIMLRDNASLESLCHSSTKNFCWAPNPPASFTTNTPRRNRFLITTATSRPRTSRKTASSKTCLKSGWKATITNGARCAATASPKSSSPAAPRRSKNSTPGPPPCRAPSAIRSTTGRISN